MFSKSKILVDYTTKAKDFQLVSPINFEINISAVDAEYIVATEIFNDRTDVNTFVPFMEKIKSASKNQYKTRNIT